MIFVLSGALIILILVVGSNDAAATVTVGTADENDDCKLDDGTVGDDLVCKSSLFKCYTTLPAASTTPGTPGTPGTEVAAAGITGKCACPKPGEKVNAAKTACEASKGSGSKAGTVAHGAECLKHDECKTHLGCFKDPAKKGGSGLPDEGATTANKLTATSAATDKGTSLCEGDKKKVIDDSGNKCNDYVPPVDKQDHGGECAKPGNEECKGDTTCRLNGEPGGSGKPDKPGTAWTASSTDKGKCLCADPADKPVHKGNNECKEEEKTVKGHGEPCGKDKCDKKFTCRVGGAKGENGDNQGTGEGTAAAEGVCVCPDKKTVPKDKSECEDAPRLPPTTGSTDRTSPDGTSGSDRIVYHLMSSVAAMGSLLFL